MLSTSFLIAILLAGAWAPIFIKFVRAWSQRENPISLAIALMVVALAYGPLWLALNISPWTWIGIFVVDVLTCLGFYGAVFLSRRRFAADDRRRKLPR